jgi:hypothetical protein
MKLFQMGKWQEDSHYRISTAAGLWEGTREQAMGNSCDGIGSGTVLGAAGSLAEHSNADSARRGKAMGESSLGVWT